MSQKYHFTVAGHEFDLSWDEVHEMLRTLKAQPVRKVYIKSWNKKFPVKQVLHEAVKGLIRTGFTTEAAVRVLTKIGFEPIEE